MLLVDNLVDFISLWIEIQNILCYNRGDKSVFTKMLIMSAIMPKTAFGSIEKINSINMMQYMTGENIG